MRFTLVCWGGGDNRSQPVGTLDIHHTNTHSHVCNDEIVASDFSLLSTIKHLSHYRDSSELSQQRIAQQFLFPFNISQICTHNLRVQGEEGTISGSKKRTALTLLLLYRRNKSLD